MMCVQCEVIYNGNVEGVTWVIDFGSVAWTFRSKRCECQFDCTLTLRVPSIDISVLVVSHFHFAAMSLDGEPVLIPPTAGHPSLLPAQLSGTKLNGHAPETQEGSPASGRLQIINDEKNFTSVLLARFKFFSNTQRQLHRTHLSSQIERWGLRDVGFNYNIAAVFGSQSTGKSKVTRQSRPVQSTE
jgi:hypothetical protein